MMQHKWLLLSLFQGAVAGSNLIEARQDSRFEWTALGDSYASGVGSTTYVDGRRCLRYDQAWPVLLNNEPGLSSTNYIFNNVVCSGAHYDDVEKYQFYDEPTTHEPNSQYGSRPAFGNPQMATLAVGGDDIDFPGILFNCILDAHIMGGPPQRTCDEQRKHTWSLINSPDLVNNIDHLIKKTVIKGRTGSIGDKFKLYVTGYGEFFNADDPGCDTVTFARTANPKPDGQDHTKLTRKLRKDFNQMSLKLNAAVQAAVDRNKNDGVKFIDIQGNGALDGHRFCEPGIAEPDQRNEKLWFWHYPYNEPASVNLNLLQEASDRVTNGLSTADLSSRYPNTTDYTNAIFDAVDFNKVQQVNGNDLEAQWGFWSSIGYRAKVFHPQVSFHNHIKDLVVAQYKKDIKPTEPEIVKEDQNNCHGVNGNVWVMHKDTAMTNVDDFCAQGTKSVEYNQGTVNHLRLSVDYPPDVSKGPSDAPECKGYFVNGVIDGCDGNDPVNNPHNYKFGSILTAGNGWIFKMEPLSLQVIEQSCDVSYKFLWNGFEVRGKNWPNAKLGTNGQGLLDELKGCGHVTEWTFKYTPNDVKYHWYAHGRLPIGTKRCVGRAVQSAGGSSAGNCRKL